VSLPVLTIDHLSATAFPAAFGWMSRLIRFIKYSDLDDRPHPHNHVDIANLTLDIFPQSRVFFAGLSRRQRTLQGILEGNVKPIAGSVNTSGSLISSGSVIAFLRKKKQWTVERAAISFLDGVGGYHFGARRDIQDILATGGLLEYAYVRVENLPDVGERALCVLLMMYSSAECVVFSERDFELLPNRGLNLGEETCIRFSDRTIILTGAAQAPPWFRPSQTVLLV
jgi:hypothetical protein